MAVPEIKKDFEAVLLNSYQHNGEKKWRRTFIANLVADNDSGAGYTLYIPEGLSISGRVRIQPKHENPEQSPTPEA